MPNSEQRKIVFMNVGWSIFGAFVSDISMQIMIIKSAKIECLLIMSSISRINVHLLGVVGRLRFYWVLIIKCDVWRFRTIMRSNPT